MLNKAIYWTGSSGAQIVDIAYLFQFMKAFVYYTAISKGFYPYLITSAEVFSRRKELVTDLAFRIPRRPYRPRILIAGKQILIRDADVFYPVDTLLNACMIWVHLVQTKYDGRLELDKESIKPLITELC